MITGPLDGTCLNPRTFGRKVSQKCPQGSVGQVVEHGSNLVAIDDYDTI
jgi:hypothetical protein